MLKGIIRLNEKAVLMLYCPLCGNSDNEYNWTLATAARYANDYSRVQTVIALLLHLIENPKKELFDCLLVCPRCNERVRLGTIPVPEKDRVVKYAQEVGDTYVKYLY